MKLPKQEQKMFTCIELARAHVEYIKDCIDDTIFEDFKYEGVALRSAVKIAIKVLTEVEEFMVLAFNDSQKSQCC
jgi:hypothetical protein